MTSSNNRSTIAPIGTTIRWIAFAPAGLAGAVLCSIMVAVVAGNVWWVPRTEFGIAMMGIVVGIAFGISAVGIGCGVAPSERKVIPAVVVAGIVALWCVPDATLFAIQGEWMLAISRVTCVLAATGAAVAFVSAGTDHTSANTTPSTPGA